MLFQENLMKKTNDGDVSDRASALNLNSELFHGKTMKKFNDDDFIGGDFLDTGKCQCKKIKLFKFSVIKNFPF